MIKRGTVKKDTNHVTCYVCGKTYEKLARTQKELRELAEEDGWRVTIPEYQMQSPTVSKEDWFATHKRRTVDVCGDCMRAMVKEAVMAVSEGRMFGQTKGETAKLKVN